MSTGVETADLIEPFLYDRLTGAADLMALVDGRVFNTFVPDDVNDVYVLFALMSALDVHAVSSGRIMVNAVYLVKVVAQTTSKDDVAPPFKIIDRLLSWVDTDRPNGHITCVRESTIDYAEVVEGQVFFHLGGQFRLRATQTT